LGLTLYFGFTSLNCYAEKPTSFGPVTKGKTLWEIAIALRPDNSVDPFQVAIALMKANPNAFSNRCNYNTLKLKETLTLPPLEQIKAIPAQEANAEFKRQGTQWKNRKTDKITCSDLLETAEAAPSPAEVTPPPVAETKPTPPPAAPQPVAPPTTSMSEPAPPATSTAPVTPPAPQPVADVKPAPEAEKSVLPAEFVKLISVMLGLFGAMLLIVFIYDRFIDVE
jgi:pilus assembly protein FimV